MTIPYYSFESARIGDRITFQTADNGFGGTGDFVDRTGTVTGKTDKSITVDVGGGQVEYKLNSHGHGYAATIGATARIRAAAWTRRNVRLIHRAGQDPQS